MIYKRYGSVFSCLWCKLWEEINESNDEGFVSLKKACLVFGGWNLLLISLVPVEFQWISTCRCTKKHVKLGKRWCQVMQKNTSNLEGEIKQFYTIYLFFCCLFVITCRKQKKLIVLNSQKFMPYAAHRWILLQQL